jgi:hypothetical protein
MNKAEHFSIKQATRRVELWTRIRNTSKPYFDAEGRYDGNAWAPESKNDRSYDQRVVIELAIAFLHGDEADRNFAEKILRANDLMIGTCAFTMDYLLALWHAAGENLTSPTRQWVLDQICTGSQTQTKLVGCSDTTKVHGQNFSHKGFNLKGIQWQGYNDNHVTMATSSLILGGELTGDSVLVEAGRASLRQMRDLLQRRGFINECNDCYLPHTMYPLASIVAWAKDEECRQLAQDGLVRIWSDLIGHWHPNLGRKIGPSARDYTEGRLSSKGWLMFLGYVFGFEALPGWLNIDTIFEPEATLPSQKFQWPHGNGQGWNLGFIARISAQEFVVPEFLSQLFYNKKFPNLIQGTNEFGNMLEIWEEVHEDGRKTQHGLHNVQYAGGSHFLTSYQEEDWGMGTADQRLLGGCPNNNWQVSYRKQRPLNDIRHQGSWYCSYTINDKCMSEENALQMIEGRPESTTPHGPVHFADGGRFAGIQQQRTAMMLYRPRPLENWKISSLGLTLLYPKHYGNEVDELWFGDQRIQDWKGDSCEIRDIFIKDGPMYIGFRPLISPWLPVDGEKPLACDIRMKAEQRGLWGAIHLFSYRGP